MKDVRIHSSWKERLSGEFGAPYFATLRDFVREEYKRSRVYPPPKQIFRAFDTTPFDDVRVVIVGQDPYHGAGQAEGLAFSVPKGVPLPPSLQNIYKEVENDVGATLNGTGNSTPAESLVPWAEQGVLLLNTTLTVRAGEPLSHSRRGWEQFTSRALESLSRERKIDADRHLVLTAPHPSPLSAHRGFFGCAHFSKANAYLKHHGIEPVLW
jgi:uracil-DNA glycosylase